MNFLDIVPISAETGLNVDTIAAIVRKHLPEATHHFPEDYITDRSQRFMASAGCSHNVTPLGLLIETGDQDRWAMI